MFAVLSLTPGLRTLVQKLDHLDSPLGSETVCKLGKIISWFSSSEKRGPIHLQNYSTLTASKFLIVFIFWGRTRIIDGYKQNDYFK